MNTVGTPATSSPIKVRQTKAGIASLVIALLSIIGSCFFFQYPVKYPPPANAIQFESYMKMLGGMLVALIVFSLMGAGLGIFGITKKNSSKALAIIGLVLNLLCAFGWALFSAYGLGAMLRR